MRALPPLIVEVNKIVPVVSVVFAAVLMTTFVPKVAGPVTVTLLPLVLSVVILPFSVTPPAPVRATVLIPLAVCVPIAPTVTVLEVMLRSVALPTAAPSIVEAKLTLPLEVPVVNMRFAANITGSLKVILPPVPTVPAPANAPPLVAISPDKVIALPATAVLLFKFTAPPAPPLPDVNALPPTAFKVPVLIVVALVNVMFPAAKPLPATNASPPFVVIAPVVNAPVVVVIVTSPPAKPSAPEVSIVKPSELKVVVVTFNEGRWTLELISTAPALTIVNPPKGTVLPTPPLMAIVPLPAVSVRLCA